jgi:muscarinic acetylcholine receptor M3
MPSLAIDIVIDEPRIVDDQHTHIILHNSSSSSPHLTSPYSTFTLILLWTVMITLSIITIVGNGMVVMAYRIDRTIRRQISNRFIISLAISDMVIGLEGFPFFTIYVVYGWCRHNKLLLLTQIADQKWPLGVLACQTWLFLDYTLCLVSIFTVLLITVDRYMSVCHTTAYMTWQTPARVQQLIIASWLLPTGVFAVMIYAWTAMTGEECRMNVIYESVCFRRSN